MADKPIYSVDTVDSMSGTDKVYVNTGNNIKQISKDDLCGNDIKTLKTEVNNNTNAIREINDNLSSEISRAKEADEILKSRVDVITSLPEGSTTGDVELQDIRVKADGTTATSAGNAVREQISELKSDISNLGNNNAPLILIPNEYITSNGEITSYSGWDRTDYIQVYEYVIINTTSSGRYNCFFDKDKEFIESVNLSIGINRIKVPSGAKYIMLSFVHGTELTINSIISTQFDELNKDMDLLIEKTGNQFDGTIFENMFVENSRDSNYGELIEYNGWNASDFFEIDYTKDYECINFIEETRRISNNCYIGIYNKHKQIIHVYTNIKGDEIYKSLFTSETKYIRVSCPSEYMDNTFMFGVSDYIENITKYEGEKIPKYKNYVETFVNDYVKDYSINSKSLRAISRLGYGNPKQSLLAYKNAIKKGFRILLCDLRFTSDGIPVLCHDDNINNIALNSDGSSISSDVKISTSTYQQLLQYDFGLRYGFPNTKILLLKDIVKLCKINGCELYVEIKSMPTQSDCVTLCNIIKQYGMEKMTSYSADEIIHLSWIKNNTKCCRLALMPRQISDEQITSLRNLQSENVSTFWFGWENSTLNDALLEKLITNDISFEIGTLDTKEDIISFFNTEINNYCTAIESNLFIANEILKEVN